MVVLEYKNKSGWLKVKYRRTFWLFGGKKYFIIGNTQGKKTYVSYSNLETAASIFNILKKAMELRDKNEKQ